MCAVSVSSLLLALLKAKPIRCAPVHRMLASSSLVPSSCFLSICWLYVCLFSGARARMATATLGLKFMSSCIEALLTQDSLPCSPSCPPFLGLAVPPNG